MVGTFLKVDIIIGDVRQRNQLLASVGIEFPTDKVVLRLQFSCQALSSDERPK